MRKVIVFAAGTMLAVFLLAILAEGQDLQQYTITVRGNEVVTGVVIISAQPIAVVPGRHASFELQCNKGASGCTSLKPGNYTMVRLPKNRGMYDCANVNIYAEDADPSSTETIGQYCLIEK